MKVDFKKQLMNLKGEPLKDQIPITLENGTRGLKEGELLTLKLVCTNSLLASQVNEDINEQTPADKLKNYNLAVKINKSDSEIEITSEEMTKIKTMVSKTYTSLVFGQVHYMLEGSYIENGPKQGK